MLQPVGAVTGHAGFYRPSEMRKNLPHVSAWDHRGQILSRLMMRHGQFVVFRWKGRAGFALHRLVMLGESQFPLGEQGRLVDEVREIRPDEPSRHRGDGLQVGYRCELHASRVQLENGQAADLVGTVDQHVAVEPASAESR